MDYLLDTNHWSYLQRKHPQVLAHLAQLPENTLLYMPVISQAELLVGVELIAAGRRKEELRRLYESTVEECTEIIPITPVVAERFASIFVQLRQDGHPIGTNDIWIAAIAIAHGLTVVSNDTDFRFIEGLRLENWTEPKP